MATKIRQNLIALAVNLSNISSPIKNNSLHHTSLITKKKKPKDRRRSRSSDCANRSAPSAIVGRLASTPPLVHTASMHHLLPTYKKKRKRGMKERKEKKKKKKREKKNEKKERKEKKDELVRNSAVPSANASVFLLSPIPSPFPLGSCCSGSMFFPS